MGGDFDLTSSSPPPAKYYRGLIHEDDQGRRRPKSVPLLPTHSRRRDSHDLSWPHSAKPTQRTVGGRRLLRHRGELLERPFAHLFETGGDAPGAPSGAFEHSEAPAGSRRRPQPRAASASGDRCRHTPRSAGRGGIRRLRAARAVCGPVERSGAALDAIPAQFGAGRRTIEPSAPSASRHLSTRDFYHLNVISALHTKHSGLSPVSEPNLVRHHTVKLQSGPRIRRLILRGRSCAASGRDRTRPQERVVQRSKSPKSGRSEPFPRHCRRAAEFCHRLLTARGRSCAAAGRCRIRPENVPCSGRSAEIWTDPSRSRTTAGQFRHAAKFCHGLLRVLCIPEPQNRG